MKTIEPMIGELRLGTRFLESGSINEAAREVPVLIIKEGMGNKVDRHFYSADLLRRVCPLFDGVKAYSDHPSKTEESDRPERSIKDIVGHYHSPKVIEVEGKAAISAILKINDGQAYDWAWNLVKEAAAFAKKFPSKDLVGISINAWGESHAVEMADGMVNMVDDLKEVQSADIVTQAGAGGGFRVREAVKKALSRAAKIKEVAPMKENLAKFGEGLKALHAEMSKNPDHAKAYGPAMEALMGAHSEMMKGCEADPAAAAPEDAEAEKKEAAKRAEENKDFEKMTENYKAGKLTPSEKVIYEALAKERAERKVEAHASMVSKAIRESGIPEAYADDLPVLCAGKTDAEVKTLIESRKKLVGPLLENRGQGAGAGTNPDGEKKDSKLSQKIAEAGVKMVAAK